MTVGVWPGLQDCPGSGRAGSVAIWTHTCPRYQHYGYSAHSRPAPIAGDSNTLLSIGMLMPRWSKRKKVLVQVECRHSVIGSLSCGCATPANCCRLLFGCSREQWTRIVLLRVDFIVVLMAGYCLPVCICLCLCPNPQLAPELGRLDWWCHIVGWVALLVALATHFFILIMLIAFFFSLFAVHLLWIGDGRECTLLSSWSGRLTIVPWYAHIHFVVWESIGCLHFTPVL